MNQPLWMWALFLGIVATLLILDLGVFHRKDHEISVKESIYASVAYILMGLLFGGWIWIDQGPQRGAEYLTGFAIEKSLALDNIFVISLIFSFFAVPRKYQYRVLFWGIIGVIVLRGIMIGLGAAIVSKFSWVLYLFAVFLIITGFKMLWLANEMPDIKSNFLVRFIRQHFNVTNDFHEHHFFVKIKEDGKSSGKWFMTPLFLALFVIEFMDLIFAVDSIPAIFAITTDTYIVYTSNIFAILGLRALYFALDALLVRFKYLKYALAVLLIFIGSKIFIAELVGLAKFPPLLALGITFSILTCGIIFSLYKTRHEK